MSDGGLLQKAMEQQETGVAEILADAVPAAEGTPSSLPFSKIASTLAVGAVLPLLLLMWFGIYLDYHPHTAGDSWFIRVRLVEIRSWSSESIRWNWN